MQEDYEEFISLTLRTRNLRKPFRMLARNWKHPWLPQCLARQARRVSMVRPVVRQMISSQNLRVSWKPVNPHDCVWKNLYQIISMERPVARLMISNYNLRLSWKPVNPQDCVWKNLHRILMRTILQEKGTSQYNITILVARGMGSPRRAKNRRRRTRRGPELACVQTPLMLGVAHAGGEGWINILPGVAKTLQWDAKEEEPGCPKRVSGRHVVRGRQFSPILEVRPGNRQGWWKRSIFRWNGRQLTLDKTVGSRVWWHTQGSSWRPASDLGWGSSSKSAPGSLSTGSPAGRTPPHADGSIFSQANVRAGKVLRPPIRALPSVIVDTEKVLREADGPVEKWHHRGSALFAPGCASKAGRASQWGARRTEVTQIDSCASSHEESRSKSSSG